MPNPRDLGRNESPELEDSFELEPPSPTTEVSVHQPEKVGGMARVMARGIGDDHLVATLLDQLGLDALMAADATTARERLTEAARHHRAIGDQEGLANCLNGLAGLLLLQGDAVTAARLCGTADALRTKLGVAVWPLLQSLVTGLADGIRATLGDQDYRREWSTGAALDPWEALDTGLAAVSVPA